MAFKVQSTNPSQYMIQYVNNVYGDRSVLKYLYSELFSGYNPDISGYSLVFMVPPDLSGYRKVNPAYDMVSKNSFVWGGSKRVPVLATMFSPPQRQMNSTAVASSAGNQKVPTEITISDTMSISYVETNNLDIYTFHQTWMNYIHEILDGTLKPDMSQYIGYNGEYNVIDYGASFYFVKFSQNLQNITYLGKAVGCTPRDLPSTELVGNRSSNELTILSFNYDILDYFDETIQTERWLRDEFEELVLSKYI